MCRKHFDLNDASFLKWINNLLEWMQLHLKDYFKLSILVKSVLFLPPLPNPYTLSTFTQTYSPTSWLHVPLTGYTVTMYVLCCHRACEKPRLPHVCDVTAFKNIKRSIPVIFLHHAESTTHAQWRYWGGGDTTRKRRNPFLPSSPHPSLSLSSSRCPKDSGMERVSGNAVEGQEDSGIPEPLRWTGMWGQCIFSPELADLGSFGQGKLWDLERASVLRNGRFLSEKLFTSNIFSWDLGSSY